MLRASQFLVMIVLLMPVASRAITVCEKHFENAFTFPNKSLATKVANAFQPEAWVRSGVQGKSSEDNAVRALRIQDWLRRYHGLKVAAANLTGEVPYDVEWLLIDIAEAAESKNEESDFADLSEALKRTTADDQLALFTSLKTELRLQTRWAQRIDAKSILISSAKLAKSQNIGILEALHRVQNELHETNEVNLQTVYPEVFTEALDAWKSGALRLTSDGTISYGADGLPDRFTYELAKRVEIQDGLFPFLSENSRSLFERLIAAQKKTLELALHDDHYKQLFEIKYSEPVEFGSGQMFQDVPLWKFLRPGATHGPRYAENSIWWTNSKGYRDYKPLLSEDSHSPALKMYGPGVERVFYWPVVQTGPSTGFNQWRRDLTKVDLSRVRIVENRRGDDVLSVEVLANHAPGLPPVQFFFVNIGGDYVPSRMFDGKPIQENQCIRCHATEKGSNRMSFKPFILNDVSAFLKLGFTSSSIIDQQMK